MGNKDSTLAMVDIVVVGSINQDWVARVTRLPRPGETQTAKSLAVYSGGKGANQAVAAARLGATVHLLACVGEDSAGQTLLGALRTEGIDVSHVARTTQAPSGCALIWVSDEGENSIVVGRGANDCLTPHHVFDAVNLFASADAVIVSCEIPLETVSAVLSVARRFDVPTFVDAGPAQELPHDIVSSATVLSPNESELHAMTKLPTETVEQVQAAAAYLRAQGAKEVVVKLGERGCLYEGNEGTQHVAAFQVVPIDTTAAGDAFTAALAIQWPQGVEQALRFANAVGALTTLKPGAQPSLPSLEDVESFLESARTRIGA
jgi:ribokinase